MKPNLGELVYDGPMPANRWAGLPTGGWRMSFVYVLFGGGGRPLYVGKAMTPSQRFDRHARKPWWSRVNRVRIYCLTAEDRIAAGRKALAAETRAIEALNPIFNVSRPGGIYVS